MDALNLNCNNLPWQEAAGYPDGTQIKKLREQDEGTTVILKIPAGFRLGGHTHIRTEQHFVLEGQYEIGDQVYTQGTYQLFPANTSHGPFTSQSGATLLIFWQKD